MLAGNPEENFAAIRQEALLLDAEYGNTQTEVTCSFVNNSRVPPKPSQGSDWKEMLKQEIMEDVKAQMSGLTLELMREIKPLLQPTVAPQPSRRFERERRRPTSYSNDRDEQGRPICHRCKHAGHIARFCREPNAPQPALN